MTVDFKSQTTYGYNRWSNYVFDVNVIGSKNVSNSTIEAAYDAVVDAAEQLYAPNSSVYYIPSAHISWYTSSFNEYQEGDLAPNAYDFLNEHSFPEGGQHLFVIDREENFSVNTAWEKTAVGFVEHDRPGWLNTAIHESLHPYLFGYGECGQVSNYSEGSDHYLGKVESMGFNNPGLKTPMLGHYGENKANQGGCSNWEDDFVYTPNLTNCTMKSMWYSYDHVRTDGEHDWSSPPWE